MEERFLKEDVLRAELDCHIDVILIMKIMQTLFFVVLTD